MGDSAGETQGDRIRGIREALRMDQFAFADALNERAKRLGVAPNYTNTKVSKLENGRQDLNPDDLFVVSDLDPKSRGERWLWSGTTSRAASVEAGDRRLTDEEIARAMKMAEEEERRAARGRRPRKREGGR